MLFGISALLLCAAISNAQAVFEAASVKPSDEFPAFTRMEGGPGTLDPSRISYRNINLQNLVAMASGVGYQQIHGPAWLDSVLVNVDATLPEGTSKAALRQMLFHLLEDRFALLVHV